MNLAIFLPRIDHLVGRVVICPGGVADQCRDLIARLHHVPEHIAVLGVSSGSERFPQTPAESIALGESQCRENIWIVGRDVDFPVRAGFVLVNVILR